MTSDNVGLMRIAGKCVGVFSVVTKHFVRKYHSQCFLKVLCSIYLKHTNIYVPNYDGKNLY